MTPEKEAISWWEKRATDHTYAGMRSDLPSNAASAYLRQKGMIAETPDGWAFVIVTPGEQAGASSLRANYWPLVRLALAKYHPGCLTRVSAVRILNGDSTARATLQAVHGANSSKRDLGILPGHVIRMTPASHLAEQVRDVNVAGVDLPVLRDADLLFTLTLEDFEQDKEDIALWLRSLALNTETIEAAYARQPRPVLAQRVAHVARELGNDGVADLVEQVVAANVRKPASRSQTKGSALVSTSVVTLPRSSQPWMDRYNLVFKHAATELTRLLAIQDVRTRIPSKQEILAWIKAAKQDDIYHSTSIEGYKITPEEVEAVVQGRAYQGRTPEETERLLALQGYDRAFRLSTAKAQQAFGGKLILSVADLLEVFQELWAPSLEAQGNPAVQASGWRNHTVFIRESLHVPPASVKVPYLMESLVEHVNATASTTAKAALAHWGIAHIHPFSDGNGRTARLLMNVILTQQGYPWATIRADERRQYFAALERAHVHQDFAELAGFLGSVLQRSEREFQGSIQPTKSTRKPTP